MWHIHEYEVKSDVLFLPDVPGPVERKDREKAPKTYEKTIHFFGRWIEAINFPLVSHRKGITKRIWKVYPKEFTQKNTLMELDSKLLYEISICIAWRPGKRRRRTRKILNLSSSLDPSKKDPRTIRTRVERFFEIQDIGVPDCLKAATICLDGKALAWFHWSQVRDPFHSWEDLKERLLERFQLTGEGNLYHQFLAIRQEGTVRDYVSNFERLSCQVGDIPESVLEDENKFSIGTPKTSGGVIRSNSSGSSRPGGASTNMGRIII
ncbi:unnamed protein product [Lactuca saligna]|uniref:Retrotransposon gag domain-containing protein n=1 Tax=Lactuca saligna TaxID=75948 RepID=A0AA35Z1D8_LACSI|nr:unnamed protein product [Lactuca saligna]